MTTEEEVIEAVENNGLALKDYEVWNDYPEVVRAAVTQNGLALEFASAALQNDSGIVFAAVRQNGKALEYASDTLKHDWSIVTASLLERCGRAPRHSASKATTAAAAAAALPK